MGKLNGLCWLCWLCQAVSTSMENAVVMNREKNVLIVGSIIVEYIVESNTN
jgi:hypothetical protein